MSPHLATRGHVCDGQKHMTLKSLQARGSLVVWFAGGFGVGTSSWRQGMGRRYGIWNSQKVDQGQGNKIWDVNKLKKKIKREKKCTKIT